MVAPPVSFVEAKPWTPVPENQCSVCAGSDDRRRQHFSTDYVRIPLKGTCIQFQVAFCLAIGLPKSGGEPPPSEDDRLLSSALSREPSNFTPSNLSF